MGIGLLARGMYTLFRYCSATRFFNMKEINNSFPVWMKSKGYTHVSRSLDIGKNWKVYKAKIENHEFVAKYAFYPLMHGVISERKYKKVNTEKHLNNKRRSHTFRLKDGDFERTAKNRPIHYASHFDALVYGYYAHLLNTQYENILKDNLELNNAVTAYRKIPTVENPEKGKSTIHFAKEVFKEIEKRAIENEEVVVLTFDIKSFFSSLDHQFLRQKWCELFGFENLPKDHENVFKSCTDFRYILRDALRISTIKNGRKAGFDEKKLAKIRRERGYKSFFEDNKDLREQIKLGKLRVYKNTFVNDLNQQVGIPQELPISAVLANLYLLDFDKEIINELVMKKNVFYRRYSDDIILICEKDNYNEIKHLVYYLIEKSKLEISKDKTEIFLFRQEVYKVSGDKRLTSIKLSGDTEKVGSALLYLGFEFRGFNVCIKATNVAKFYRRMISIVKRRANRAKKSKDPALRNVVFKNQIKKLYKRPLQNVVLENENKTIVRRKTFLIQNEKGEYSLRSKPVENNKQSNYFSYLSRCENIFKNQQFKKQFRKKDIILNSAIKKFLNN